MDPKQNPKPLDPKLQEAYDRVMGISLTPDPQQPGTTNPPSPSDPVSAAAPTATPTGDPFANQANPALTDSPTSSSPMITGVVATPQATIPTADPFSSAPLQQTSPSPFDVSTPTPPATTSLDPSTPIPSSPVGAFPPVDPSLTTPVQSQPNLGATPPVLEPSTPPSVVTPVVPSGAPTESLSATIPLAHSSETVSIGNLTGSAAKQGGKKGISPVIILLGGVVFLIVYVLFWVKIFGLPIPFINQ